MEANDRSILVIGAGAIGGITAAFLKKAGYNVEIVCKYDEYRDLAMDRGLIIGGKVKQFTQKVPAYSSIEHVNGQRDIILLAVKATDLESVAHKIKPMMHDSTMVVAMQNGITEYELEKILGKGRVVSCIVGFGATMSQPGSMQITSGGNFVIGYLEGENRKNLDELEGMLSVILPVRQSENMIGDRFSKLIINSCITSLGALTGLLLGEMLRKRKARVLFIEIMKEAMELAYIMKIRVENYGGMLNFYEFLGRKGFLSSFKRHLTIRYIGMKFRKVKSSSLQSLEKGSGTEIDNLKGFISTNGRELGIPVPVNTSMVEMIHEIEEGKRKMTPHNLDDVRFEKYSG